MWSGDGDVPSSCFVVDLEWIGDSSVPSEAHVTQIAAKSVKTGSTFSCMVRPLASLNAVNNGCTAPQQSNAVPPANAFISFMEFINVELKHSSGPAVLIAHNGIRFDSPILLENMRRSGVPVPGNIVFLDSLHHFRHHLRHRETCANFSLDGLCALLDIPIDVTARHTALYDVELLHETLLGMQTRWGIPYISGLPQHLNVFSPMLVHGIGPTVCMHLGASSLLEMCGCILDKMGSLSPACCQVYLKNLHLNDKLPYLDTNAIADNIGPAAKRYLHYLP